MTTPIAPPSRRRSALASSPIWVVAANVALVVAIVVGFDVTIATIWIKPRIFAIVMLLLIATIIAFGPLRQIQRVVVSFSALAYLTWWMASYLWTDNPWIFLRDTQLVFPMVACVVVVGSLLPREQFVKALLLACYLSLAWSAVFTILNPGLAMSHPDGDAGWRAAFGHKNAMAPFMVFAIATIGTLENTAWRRQAAIAVALVFLVMSQSVTGFVVGLVLLAFSRFLHRLEKTPPESRAGLLVGGLIIGLVITTVCVINVPTLVEAVGKDPTLSRRTEIWDGVVDAIEDQPLHGYGVGGVWVNTAVDPTRSILEGLGFAFVHSHNGFLEIALQLGLIGLALFAVLLLSYVRSSLALMSVDGALSRYFLLYAALIVLTSISEVTTFGIWLALLCGFQSCALRELGTGRPR